MRKKTPKHKPKSADTLLKTSKKAQVELTEQQLGKVSGGLGKLDSAATPRLVAVVDFCQPWVMCCGYGRWATDYPVVSTSAKTSSTLVQHSKFAPAWSGWGHRGEQAVRATRTYFRSAQVSDLPGANQRGRFVPQADKCSAAEPHRRQSRGEPEGADPRAGVAFATGPAGRAPRGPIAPFLPARQYCILRCWVGDQWCISSCTELTEVLHESQRRDAQRRRLG